MKKKTLNGERIILTPCGKPKAALVSTEDYQQLLHSESRGSDLQKWMADIQVLASQIAVHRGKAVDVDNILEASRSDLEVR